MSSAGHAGIPLCVDLDGTLLDGDINVIAVRRLLARKPWMLFVLPFWALRGRPSFKRYLAAQIEIDPASLRYHEDVVRWLEKQRAEGRRIVLATASRMSMVLPIAAHFPFFDKTVIATEDGPNLSGSAKAKALVALFGEKGFDYAGNERRDLEIWAHARHAIVVHAPQRVLERARTLATVECIIA